MYRNLQAAPIPGAATRSVHATIFSCLFATQRLEMLDYKIEVRNRHGNQLFRGVGWRVNICGRNEVIYDVTAYSKQRFDPGIDEDKSALTAAQCPLRTQAIANVH